MGGREGEEGEEDGEAIRGEGAAGEGLAERRSHVGYKGRGLISSIVYISHTEVQRCFIFGRRVA